METVEIYLDLPLLGGFLSWVQDAALLWMVGQISGCPAVRWRWIVGGAVGGCFQFILLICEASRGTIHGWVLIPAVFGLIVPALMLGITFLPLPRGKMWRILGIFFLLAFLLAGIQWSLECVDQRFIGKGISLGWRFLIHLGSIFILGELGWGAVHRKIWERRCLYQVELHWNDCRVEFKALLDTGNQLCDPLTKEPVLVVEFALLKPFLPQRVIAAVKGLQTEDYGVNWDLPPEWEGRLRLLPFHSVGKQRGMLIGFRPDWLVVRGKEQEYINRRLVVAFHQAKLTTDDAYQGLIPPVLLGT